MSIKDIVLTNEERDFLLDIVRTSVRSAVTGDQLQKPEMITGSKIVNKKFGVFVTIKNGLNLRGCIGHLKGYNELWQEVKDVAISAALNDPRFLPVDSAELEYLKYEITILGEFIRLNSPEELSVGNHGLSIEHKSQYGILLPQVAVEQGWDTYQFLEAVCRKAGLPGDAWRKEEANLKYFSAIVID